MKPAELKSVAQVAAAGGAIFEARIIVESWRQGGCVGNVDIALRDLELAYYRRADELRECRRGGGKS